MENFPGGVLSKEASIGVTRILGNRLVAVDVSAGTVIWTRDSNAYPLATTARYVIVLICEPRLELAVLDIRTGAEAAKISEQQLPPAFASFEDRPQSVEVEARDTDPGIMLEWSVEAQYSGGAAPRQLDVAAKKTSGSLSIDVSTRRAMTGNDPLPSHESEGITASEKSSQENRRYDLKVCKIADGRQIVLLEAFRNKDHDKLWDVELAEVKETPSPRPLRK